MDKQASEFREERRSEWYGEVSEGGGAAGTGAGWHLVIPGLSETSVQLGSRQQRAVTELPSGGT